MSYNCLLCGQNKIDKTLKVADFFLFFKKSSSFLCSNCANKFVKLDRKNSCPRCLKQKTTGAICLDCKRWRKLYSDYDFHNDSLYQYNQAMEAFFQQYKFNGDYRIRVIFAEVLKHYFRKYRDYLIVPIPISSARFKQRRFNQVLGLLEVAKIKYLMALGKEEQSSTEFQSHKTRAERLKTPQPFFLVPKLKKILFQQKVLLVDDIYTTGRTLFHAYDRIKEAQPQEIRTFTLAR